MIIVIQFNCLIMIMTVTGNNMTWIVIGQPSRHFFAMCATVFVSCLAGHGKEAEVNGRTCSILLQTPPGWSSLSVWGRQRVVSSVPLGESLPWPQQACHHARFAVSVGTSRWVPLWHSGLLQAIVCQLPVAHNQCMGSCSAISSHPWRKTLLSTDATWSHFRFCVHVCCLCLVGISWSLLWSPGVSFAPFFSSLSL